MQSITAPFQCIPANRHGGDPSSAGDRKQVAALVGVAPYAFESGKLKGARCIWGGRAPVRRVAARSAGARSASLDATKSISDLPATR
jgi:Transposase IS116/IS110/IS902 family